MNKTFRSVWNDKKQAYVAAAEITRSGGKRASAVLQLAAPAMALLSLMGTAGAADLPTGAQLVGGNGSVTTSGNAMTIHQASSKMAIDWQSFSIGQGKTVEFVQPNASAVALNRVLGTDASVIQGALKANGQVFLVNPSGVLFAPTAQVDVGGIVASTLDIKPDDFMAGKATFERYGARGSVVNQGNLKAANGGYVALLGQQVSNQGVITATLGSAMLAAGDKVSLNFSGNRLVGVTIDRGTLDALVENKQAIYADGGKVHLTSQALDTVLNGVVNNTGIIEAKGMAPGQNGEIILFAHGGTVNVGGSLKAPGGFVETSGKEFAIQPAAAIEAGQWLIDPVNITIDSTLATSISSALGSGDVTIQTTGACSGVTCSGSAGAGDIVVNSAITKSTGTKTKLTLAADHDISVNATISGSAGSPLDIVLASRYNGGTLGGVYVGASLKSFGGDITIGGGDMNASGYAITHSSTPYGDNKSGIFIDQAIIDATSDGSGTADNTLPTATSGGNITMRGKGDLNTAHQFNEGVYFYIRKTIGVVTGGSGNIYIEGHGGQARSHFWDVAAIGVNWESDNTYIKANTGDITIKGYAGTVADQYGISSGNTFIGTNGYLGIQGDSYMIRGGAVNINVGGSGDINAPFMGVSGASYSLTKSGAGVLNFSADAQYWNNNRPSNTSASGTNGTFTDAANTVNLVNLTRTQALYAFSTVPTTLNSVTQSAATPTVTTTTTTPASTAVSYLFPTLSATCTYNGNPYSLSSLWSASDIFGSSYSSWVAGTDYTFQYSGGTVTGFTNAGTYSDITANILKTGYTVATSGNTSGTLTISPKSLTLSATKIYDGGLTLSGTQINIGGLIGSQTLTYSGATLNTRNVGTGNFISAMVLANGSNGGLASNYQLPTLNAQNAAATVTAKTLSVTGTTVVDKAYDGTTSATLSGGALQGVVNGDAVSLVQAGSFADKNAGAGKTVTANYSLSGSDSGNYTLTQPTSLSGNIARKSLTITGTTVADKTYDGTATANVATGAVQGVVAGDQASVTASGTFSDANTGVGKQVQVTYTVSDPNYSLANEWKQANITKAYGSGVEQAQTSVQSTTMQPQAAAPSAGPSLETGLRPQTADTRASTSSTQVTAASVSAALGTSENLMLVSAPRGQEANALVSLGEAKNLLTGTASGNTASVEVRVPSSRGSISEIVNGGLKLPDGVEQQLFVVQN